MSYAAEIEVFSHLKPARFHSFCIPADTTDFVTQCISEQDFLEQLHQLRHECRTGEEAVSEARAKLASIQADIVAKEEELVFSASSIQAAKARDSLVNHTQRECSHRLRGLQTSYRELSFEIQKAREHPALQTTFQSQRPSSQPLPDKEPNLELYLVDIERRIRKHVAAWSEVPRNHRRVIEVDCLMRNLWEGKEETGGDDAKPSLEDYHSAEGLRIICERILAEEKEQLPPAHGNSDVRSNNNASKVYGDYVDIFAFQSQLDNNEGEKNRATSKGHQKKASVLLDWLVDRLLYHSSAVLALVSTTSASPPTEQNAESFSQPPRQVRDKGSKRLKIPPTPFTMIVQCLQARLLALERKLNAAQRSHPIQSKNDSISQNSITSKYTGGCTE